VTGERIRDKIAASKKKGLWMGGFVPFGYRAKDRTLTIDEKEADTVRMTFRRYLELRSVNKLHAELAHRDLRTRAFVSASNKQWGNRPFSRGHLYYLLSNPIYAGKIAHRDKQYDGQHEAIVDRKTFAAVQAQLAANNRNSRTQFRAKEPSLLAGLLADTNGNRLASSHAVKNGKRYRYYVGTRTEQGQAKAWRLPASQVEAAVIGVLQRFLVDRQRVTKALALQKFNAHQVKEALWNAKQLETEIAAPATRRDAIATLISRVLVSESKIDVEIKLSAMLPAGVAPTRGTTYCLKLPIELVRRNGEMTVIVAGGSLHETKADPVLVKAIARGFAWFEQLASDQGDTIKSIAKRERVTDRYVSRMIELAFLSPEIVQAALRGTRGVRVSAKQLVLDVKLPMAWSLQSHALSQS
jgi:hypothetical protein